MTLKEVIKKSYDDLLNLKFTFKNVFILAIIVIIFSIISTPIIGVPVGLLSGAYYLQKQEDKKK